MRPCCFVKTCAARLGLRGAVVLTAAITAMLTAAPRTSTAGVITASMFAKASENAVDGFTTVNKFSNSNTSNNNSVAATASDHFETSDVKEAAEAISQNGAVKVANGVSVTGGTQLVQGQGNAIATWDDVVHFDPGTPAAEKAKASLFEFGVDGKLGTSASTLIGFLPSNDFFLEADLNVIAIDGSTFNVGSKMIHLSNTNGSVSEDFQLQDPNPLEGVELFLSMETRAEARRFLFGSESAFATFNDTALVTGVGLLDAAGNLLPTDSYTVTSALGFSYPLLGPAQSVPEPSGLVLLAIGAGAILGRSRLRLALSTERRTQSSRNCG